MSQATPAAPTDAGSDPSNTPASSQTTKVSPPLKLDGMRFFQRVIFIDLMNPIFFFSQFFVLFVYANNNMVCVMVIINVIGTFYRLIFSLFKRRPTYPYVLEHSVPVVFDAFENVLMLPMVIKRNFKNR